MEGKNIGQQVTAPINKPCFENLPGDVDTNDYAVKTQKAQHELGKTVSVPPAS